MDDPATRNEETGWWWLVRDLFLTAVALSLITIVCIVLYDHYTSADKGVVLASREEQE